MTEAEWLACTDPRRLLEDQYRQAIADKPRWFLFEVFRLRRRTASPRARVSDRELRLFACACCRREGQAVDEQSRRMIEVAERFADGQAPGEELRQSAALARSPVAAWLKAEPIAEQPGWLFTTWLASGSNRKRAEQVALLRHIVGNPFRSPQAPCAWPGMIVALAEALYGGEPCGFALHDALLESDHAELAEHFDEPEHPRGCWALDLLLGKR
jgi:hypothetical protein